MTNLNQYLVLELGLAPKELRRLTIRELGSLEHVHLFDGTPEEAIRHVGPLLVALSSDSPLTAKSLTDWETKYSSGVIQIATELALDDLANHLRNRLTVVLPTGEERLFRFYDPSVFGILDRELDNEQYWAFWQPLALWRTAGQTSQWVTFRPEGASRREPDSITVESPPEPKDGLPEGHFRLNWRTWNQLRFAADMRQIRALIENDPDFRWFGRLEQDQQNHAFEEIVYRPLQSSGMNGLSDLHTAALLAMSYPQHDVWAMESVQKAVQDAIKNEGEFRKSLASHVSAPEWAELAGEVEQA